jgi:hypothetical protein
MQGRNDPLLAELAQHLAEAFDLRPPKGYVRAARWGVYDVEVLLCTCFLTGVVVTDSRVTFLRVLGWRVSCCTILSAI